MTALGSLLVIALAVFAILRRAEVRLTLGLAALALGCLAGKPMLIVQTFLTYFTREQFLLPIGCCMGFAYVLKHTECDQHMVHLLLRPLQRVRILLIPGVVLVGAAVNVPIISQAGAIIAVGTVLAPILRGAGVAYHQWGGPAAGGEHRRRHAQSRRAEYRTLHDAVGARGIDCVAKIWPLFLIHIAVAVPLFWVICLRADRRANGATEAPEESTADPEAASEQGKEAFRINCVKALVPAIPLLLLFLTALPPPLRALEVPHDWLAPPAAKGASFDSRLIAAAMLVGAAAAALTDLRKAGGVGRAFFEGAGFALANIVSVIVVANCFGKGVAESGLVAHLHDGIAAAPGLLTPAAAVLPMGFAWVCGSGMAATQSLFGFFVAPAEQIGVDPLRLGAVVSLSAAAGRTMSPVRAVVLLASRLTGTEPLAMIRRTALPLAAGVVALVAAALLLG